MGDFEELEQERFVLPPRLMLASKLKAVIAAKVSDLAKSEQLTDEEKAFVATVCWFETDDRTIYPLPLVDADTFGISFVSGHDEKENDSEADPAEATGNSAVAVFLYRDGSPFVYDEDIAAGVYGTEYTVLVGPDAPPTLIHQEHLERASIEDNRTREYSHGNWRDLSVVMQILGPEYLHPLDDQDCEHLLTAVSSAQVNPKTYFGKL